MLDYVMRAIWPNPQRDGLTSYTFIVRELEESYLMTRSPSVPKAIAQYLRTPNCRRSRQALDNWYSVLLNDRFNTRLPDDHEQLPHQLGGDYVTRM